MMTDEDRQQIMQVVLWSFAALSGLGLALGGIVMLMARFP